MLLREGGCKDSGNKQENNSSRVLKMCRPPPCNDFNQITKKCYSHNIGHYSTTRGNEHDISLDGVVVTDEALHSQVHQHSRYQPDGENRQQCTQDLCINKRRGERRDLQSNTLFFGITSDTVGCFGKILFTTMLI